MGEAEDKIIELEGQLKAAQAKIEEQDKVDWEAADIIERLAAKSAARREALLEWGLRASGYRRICPECRQVVVGNDEFPSDPHKKGCTIAQALEGD